jgi:hypothetical protein
MKLLFLIISLKKMKKKIIKKVNKMWSSWISNEDNATIKFDKIKNLSADDIVRIFKDNKVEYPLRRRYYTREDLFNSFDVLKNYEADWSNEEYTVRERLLSKNVFFRLPGDDDWKSYFLFTNKEGEFETIDWIVDYFIEEARLHCMRKGRDGNPIPSPYDSWYSYNMYVKTAVSKLLKNREDLSLRNLRERLYEDKKIPECPHEKPSFLVSLFKIFSNFENPSIFDASAGWGDRLLASMVIESTRYLGIDPNTSTQKGFKEMVDLLGDGDHDRFSVLPLSMPDLIQEDGTTLEVDLESFDIAFLSPPSFDSELYSSDPGQSIERWNDEKSWYMNFLFPTIDKCWSVIKPTGVFIVQSILIEKIAPYVEYKFENSFFCGPISVEASTRNKPMWIWYKIEDESTLTENQQIETQTLKFNSRKHILERFPELNENYRQISSSDLTVLTTLVDDNTLPSNITFQSVKKEIDKINIPKTRLEASENIRSLISSDFSPSQITYVDSLPFNSENHEKNESSAKELLFSIKDSSETPLEPEHKVKSTKKAKTPVEPEPTPKVKSTKKAKTPIEPEPTPKVKSTKKAKTPVEEESPKVKSTKKAKTPVEEESPKVKSTKKAKTPIEEESPKIKSTKKAKTPVEEEPTPKVKSIKKSKTPVEPEPTPKVKSTKKAKTPVEEESPKVKSTKKAKTPVEEESPKIKSTKKAKTPVEPEPTPKTLEIYELKDLEKKTIPELKEILRERKLPVTAKNKAEYMKRIIDNQ